MNNAIEFLGSNLIIQIDKETMIEEGTGFLLLEILYELMAEEGIITVNEINNEHQSYDYLHHDGNIYFFTYEDICALKENGRVKLVKQGRVEDFIDYSNKQHTHFLEWLGH